MNIIALNKDNQNQNTMGYFTFEHECDNAPMTLTIYVEYSMWSWHGTYDMPAELEIDKIKYTIACGRLDMTALLNSCSDDRLTDEIEDAINTAIWNDHNNK